MALRDLLVKFGVDVEGKQKIDAVDDSLKATLRSANAFGRTMKQVGAYLLVGAIVRGVKEFIVGQMQQADALKHNAERLGVTSDEMQKYEYVSGIVGVSAQQTAVGFRFLDRAIGEAALGTKSATKVFAQLGVHIYEQGTKNIKPTSEIIMELSDAFKKTPSQAIRVALAMRTLGRGGSSLLPMLQKGSVELKQMFDDVDMLGGGFNETFVEDAHEADVGMKRLKMGMRSVFVAVATELLPIFIKWVKNSIKNVKIMIDFAKHTYGVRTAIMALTSGTVIFGLMRLSKVLGLGKLGTQDFLKAFINYGPLLLAAAAVAMLYLAADDLYTLITGGKSVVGDWLDSIGGDGTAAKFVKDLKNGFEQLSVALTGAGDGFKLIVAQAGVGLINTIPEIIKWGGVFTVNVIGLIYLAIAGLKQLYAVMGAVGGLMIGDLKDASYWWSKVDQNAESMSNTMDAVNKMTDVFMHMGSNKQTQGEADAQEYARKFGPNRMNDNEGSALMPTREPTQIKINQNITINGDKGTTARELSQATKSGVKDGLAEHRDTYDAVGAGMPAGSAM